MTQLSDMLFTLIYKLIRPHPRIQDKEEQQSSQLLAGLLLTTLLAVALILTLVLYLDSRDINDARTQAGFIIAVLATVFYLLNYFGHFRRALTGFIGLLTVVMVVTPYIGTADEFTPFVVTPMLLVGIFYSFRRSFVFNLGIIIIIFVLNSFVTDDTIWERRTFWYFLLFAGALIVTFKWHLNRLEQIRRKELDELNSQLKATLDALPDTLLEVDARGQIIKSHSPEKLGYTWDNFAGKSPGEVLPESVAKTIMDGFEEARKTGQHSGASFSLELSGGIRWFEISISAIGDEAQASRFVVIARDITERKQTEELRIEREKLQADFEKEKELAELRSQLISIISHEFRTPLTIILTSSTLLVKYHERLSSEKRKEKIESIMLQVKRLDKMLDTVSTYSKLQRGFLDQEIEAIEISDFCEGLVQELRGLLQANQELNLIIHHQFETILLPEDLLRHALTNLLSNAIKYSPEGGTVTLEIDKNNQHLQFIVRDEGIGIPEEDMNNLFKPFHRASNVNNIQGTGLGLSITKQIVEMQGGKIDCISKVNKGTTFQICIPIPQVNANV